MAELPNLDNFRFPPNLKSPFEGRRVLITGAGKHGGLGQSFALAAALNGAEAVGVHFYRSYDDALETVDAINEAGGNAFPVQADVTNTSDVWSIRSYVIGRMGGSPPDLVICNSGLSEAGYLLGRPPRELEDESPAHRRSRARQAFVDNLGQSTLVVDTKVDGFMNMTHLWAGEAMHFKRPLQIVYVSSRQAVDPGAGVPGYVLANFAVLSLPRILRTNLGRKGDGITAFSLALPFVRTSMTQALVDKPKVFGRWQPRMLETNEAAFALGDLLGRPAEELDDHVFQLDVAPGPSGDEREVSITWSDIDLTPSVSPLAWSSDTPLVLK